MGTSHDSLMSYEHLTKLIIGKNVYRVKMIKINKFVLIMVFKLTCRLWKKVNAITSLIIRKKLFT